MKSKELIRTIKFVLFSISAGVIQVLSFTLLNELLTINYWVSYLVSLILSVLWNFTLNRKFMLHLTYRIHLIHQNMMHH